MEDFIVPLVLFVVSFVISLIGKKTKVPKRPNVPTNAPQHDSSMQEPPTQSPQDVTWTQLIEMISGEMKSRNSAPETQASTTSDSAPRTNPTRVETQRTFLDSSHEGESRLNRTVATPIPMVNIEEEQPCCETPTTAQEWRKAIIANEILTRKY